MPKPDPGESRLTYEQWKACGFQVCKGEKAMGRNRDGVALFGSSQIKPVSHKRWDSGDGDDDYNEDMMIDDYVMDIGDR